MRGIARSRVVSRPPDVRQFQIDTERHILRAVSATNQLAAD